MVEIGVAGVQADLEGLHATRVARVCRVEQVATVSGHLAACAVCTEIKITPQIRSKMVLYKGDAAYVLNLFIGAHRAYGIYCTLQDYTIIITLSK